MPGVHQVIRSIRMKVIRVIVAQKGPVTTGPLKNPEYSSDVCKVSKTMVLPIGSAVPHNRQAILGISN